MPGVLTDFGTIHFGVLSDQACPRLFSPSWSHDGSRLIYLYREPTPFVGATNNPWQIGANPPVGTLGARLLDMDNYANRDRPYRIVSAPTAERGDEMLFLELESGGIYHGDVINPASHMLVDLGSCPAFRCTNLDITWLPDSSGFVFSQYQSSISTSDPPEGGVLYRYDFATGQASEIIRIPDEAIGKLSIAPDGDTIVFERGPRLDDALDRFRWGSRVLCPCQLWTVDHTGSNLAMLLADGRAPAWSPTAPPVSVTAR